MAAFAVMRWLATKEHLSLLLPTGGERAFVQDLVYTTVRRLRPLRHVLGKFVKTWPKGELEALLYIGAAQILYMDDVPDFAAVHETVEAAKTGLNPAVARVVNGVLRNLLRQREALEAELAAAPADLRESFPSALYRRWTERYGHGTAARLAAWHNRPAETYLARPDGFTPLPRGQRVEDQPGYAQGAFIVQDPATALAVELMDVRPGERTLDACAAPGGKTVQLAWRGADVTACEVNPKRRKTLEDTLRRTHQAVRVLGALPAAGGETFQKVLADAPCSNTGVLRRRPDARWNWSPARLAEAVRLQAEILDRVAPLVAPLGRLVYATCSNEPEENEEQTDAFLVRHPEFHRLEARSSLPVESGCDGAYAVAFERDAETPAEKRS